MIFSALGGTTGSVITGVVFGKFDGQTAFYLSLVPLTIIMLTLYLFKRETEKDTGELVGGAHTVS